MTKKTDSISIIIPALNEAPRLPGAVRTARTAARQHFDDYEIIIINDGSTDETGAVADHLAEEDERVRVVHNDRPHNLGGAFKKGVALARSTHVTLINGKDDTSPEELGKLFARRREAEIVVAYTLDASYRNHARQSISRLFTIIINKIFGLNMRYYNHIVLHRTELLRSIEIRTDSYAFQAEALVKLLRRGHSYLHVGHRDKTDNEGGTRSYKLRNLFGAMKFFSWTLFDIYARDKYRPAESSATEPVHWWRTEIGAEEIAGVEGSMRRRRLSQGPVAEEFERRLAERLDVPHVVAAPSGSAALAMALLACDVGPGDEVIVPCRTFMATANAAVLIGARPRLVDVERDRPIIDVAKIEAALTDKTKAILPVHLNGRAADMDRLLEIAASRGIRVVEDAAQAFCSRDARGRPLGAQGDLGAFSLGVTKLITTGQGGFVATRDDALAEKLRKIRNHGSIEPLPQHYNEFGFNFKITDMLAGMGLAQLDKLPEKIERHREIYRFYEEALRGLDYIKLIKVDVENGELPLWAEALCENRERVVALLNERDIHPRPFIASLSESAYLKSPESKETFPNSEVFAQGGLILPCGPDQTKEDLERVAGALHDIAGEI